MITVNFIDTVYEVEIMDETHLRMRSKGTGIWGIPWHIAQLDNDIIEQLRKQGYVDKISNGFKLQRLLDGGV
jgi:hypothetical protein